MNAVEALERLEFSVRSRCREACGQNIGECDDCQKKCTLYEALMVLSEKVLENTGEWIDYSDVGFVECPKCGAATSCDDNKDDLKYCWKCGCSMKSPEGK